MTTELLKDIGFDIAGAESKQKQRIAEIKNLGNPVSAKPQALAFVGVLLLGFFIIGMIGMQIITGAVAMVVAALAASFLFYGFRIMRKMDPLFKQKLNNELMKRMTEEAKKHKIETLDNMVLSSKERLDARYEAIKKLKGYKLTLEDKIKPDDPNLAKKQEGLNVVITALENSGANYEKAKQMHSDLKDKVASYKDMHEFSEVMNDVTQFINGSESELEEMLSLAAFNEIDKDFNMALAAIDTETRYS